MCCQRRQQTQRFWITQDEDEEAAEEEVEEEDEEAEVEERQCDELHLCQCFESCLLLQSVDWWSLGILMFELLTGASPFTLEGERNSQSEVSK